MGATRLDGRADLVRFAADSGFQVLHCRQQLFLCRQAAGNVDCRREDVVGRLAEVDVVVGVHDGTRALCSQVGDHFVRVHVGAGARARLKHVDRELPVMLSLGDFVSSLCDGLRDARLEQSELAVDVRCGTLDETEYADEAATEDAVR